MRLKIITVTIAMVVMLSFAMVPYLGFTGVTHASGSDTVLCTKQVGPEGRYEERRTVDITVPQAAADQISQNKSEGFSCFGY